MAFLRFVNTIFNGPDLNVYIQNVLPGSPEILVVENLAYANATPYFFVAPNTQYNVIVRNNLLPPTTLATTTVFPLNDRDYTLVIGGTVNAVTVTVFQDDNRCLKKKGRVTLRFINAAALNPTAVDLLADGHVVFNDVAYLNSGSPTYVPARACTFGFQVNVAGSDSILVPTTGLNLRKDFVYTLFLIGDPTLGLTLLPVVNKSHC
jgi:hypothetical protein